jgi:protein involved in polysaccharide export with SLBB domain
MKIKVAPILLIFFICVFFACASQQPIAKPSPAASPAAPQTLDRYLIQPGDQLDIKFFYNPEINESVTVRPDGKISLQLIDEVQAAGMKPSQLDDVLTKKYSKELKKPVVTVIVKSFAGQRIYVGGEVNSQGLMTLTPGMTPLQAVFNAVPIEMDLDDMMQGKSDSANFFLQPDDVVYVPKTAIAKANKFVNQYIEKLFLFKGVSLGFSYELHSESNN